MTAYVYSSGGFPASPVTNDTLVINNAIYDWTGTIWQSRSTNATATRLDFVATAGQSTKTDLTYTVGNIDCYLNGSKLTLGTDFTATDGVSVTFAPALTLNDEVQLIMDAGVSGSASGESSVGGVADFVASGTLPNGTPVILNTDGTVSSVVMGSIPIAENIPAGNSAIINAGGADGSTSFDPFNPNRFACVYPKGSNSNTTTIIIGEVTGTTITFGTELALTGANATYVRLEFDPSTPNMLVVVFSSGNLGKALVCTVSGTTATFSGSAYTFNSGRADYIQMAFDPNTAGKFVIAYQDLANSNYGSSIIGNVSGTTITFGVKQVFFSSGAYVGSVAFDPHTANRFAVSCSNGSNSDRGEIVLGYVTGTSVTFSASSVFTTDAVYHDQSCSFDLNTANRLVVTYTDRGNSYYGTAVIGTITASSISYGTPVVYAIGNTDYVSADIDSNTPDKFAVLYKDANNSSYGTVIVGTIAGTTIAFGSPYVVNSSGSYANKIVFNPHSPGQFVAAIGYSASQAAGIALVGQMGSAITSTNLTTTNFIGIPDAAYADTVTATVTLPAGLSINQSGLVAGSEYYIQNDGTLSTTAGNPSVLIGKALSATSILLKAY